MSTLTFPEGVIALPIDEAKKEYGALLRKKEATDGLFVYVPPKMNCKSLELSSKDGVYLFVGRHASLNFVGESPEFEISLEEGARASYTSTRSVTLHVALKKEAHFEMVSVVHEAKQVLSATLVGEESSVSFKGLSLLEEKQRSNIDVLIRHVAPNCRSYQHFKAVVRDRARFAFAGKIYVEREAQKTDAYQLCNALLLGEHALASMHPNLEIFADDVKASHGATIGQLDGDELFYLRTRGFTLNQAQESLIKGFCDDILRLCSNDA